MSRNIKITLSGVGNDAYHDGQLACKYIYSSSNPDRTITDMSYSSIIANYSADFPAYIDFKIDTDREVSRDRGIYCLEEGGNYFSIYRREYQIYQRTYRDNYNNLLTEQKTYAGEWVPVAVRVQTTLLRDFNVTNDRSYQYILYPDTAVLTSKYANATAEEKDYGKPVVTSWDEWSLTELIPVDNKVDAPILRKTYEVDVNNVWLFKYSLETGSQNQTFQKNEIQTLGQYPRFGYGRNNYVSGDVSCLLGSEIVPYTSDGYVERMRASIKTPLSANEKTYMLRQWRKIAFSPNPKLLKDMKGQSWIVQITSNSNTPQNFYKNQPDTISFSWKQIDNTDNIVITGDGLSSPTPGCADTVWTKVR